MLKDAKCFKNNIKKQNVSSALLVEVLLSELYKEGVINSATYVKAKEEKKNEGSDAKN